MIWFGLLGWIPLFLATWLLIPLFGESVASAVAMVGWFIVGVVLLVRYSSWRCPHCQQRFACAPRVGYAPSGLWLLGRTCRNCGYKIQVEKKEPEIQQQAEAEAEHKKEH